METRRPAVKTNSDLLQIERDFEARPIQESLTQWLSSGDTSFEADLSKHDGVSPAGRYRFLIAWVCVNWSDRAQEAEDFASWAMLNTSSYGLFDPVDAENLFIDYLRQEGPVSRCGLLRDRGSNTGEVDPNVYKCQQNLPDEYLDVKKFYGKLKAKFRDAFRLYHEIGYSMLEISAMYQCSEATISNRIARATQYLRNRHSRKRLNIKAKDRTHYRKLQYHEYAKDPEFRKRHRENCRKAKARAKERDPEKVREQWRRQYQRKKQNRLTKEKSGTILSTSAGEPDVPPNSTQD